MDSEKDDSVEGSDISDESIKTDHTTTPIDKDFTKKELKESKSFKPTKLIGFPTSKIEIQFKDENDRVMGYWKTRKHKDEKYFVKILPKGKKNPDKETYANVGRFPFNSQIYTYKNNDAYVYIGKGTDYIQFTTEDFFMLLSQLIGHSSVDSDFNDKIIMASISLQLKHFKRPYVKVPLDKIKEFKLEDIVNEYIKDSDEQREERKKKFGTYK